MTTIVTILTDGYADWEAAMLNAGARQYYGITTRFASPGGVPVLSGGGTRVTPDLAAENIDVTAIDALIVNGGTIWSRQDAPDISAILLAAHRAGKTICGICDGTIPLARAGLLDAADHTANAPETLAGTGYGGAGRYKNEPRAVRDGTIVTAPGVAPVTFMGAVLESLGLRDPDLDFYMGLYAAEHGGAPDRAPVP